MQSSIRLRRLWEILSLRKQKETKYFCHILSNLVNSFFSRMPHKYMPIQYTFNQTWQVFFVSETFLGNKTHSCSTLNMHTTKLLLYWSSVRFFFFLHHSVFLCRSGILWHIFSVSSSKNMLEPSNWEEISACHRSPHRFRSGFWLSHRKTWIFNKKAISLFIWVFVVLKEEIPFHLQVTSRCLNVLQALITVSSSKTWCYHCHASPWQ